jgi:hypothetical protein
MKDELTNGPLPLILIFWENFSYEETSQILDVTWIKKMNCFSVGYLGA